MLQKRRAAWMAIVLMFMLSTPVDAWAASSSAMDDSAHPAVKIASFDLRNPQIEMGSAVSGNGSGLRNNDGIYLRRCVDDFIAVQSGVGRRNADPRRAHLGNQAVAHL